MTSQVLKEQAHSTASITEKGYEHLAELARKRKPVVISEEDWQRLYLKKNGRRGVLIDGDPNMRAASGKPCYFYCSQKGEPKEVCIYLPLESDFHARQLAAIELQCEPGQVKLRGPFFKVDK